MQFPSQKIHRVSRRHLGRGQSAAPAAITTFTTAAGAIATVTFTRPVTVKGPVNLRIPGFSAIAQSVVSPTQLAITFNASIDGQPWTLPTPPANVTSPTGAQILGGSGMFTATETQLLHVANIGGGMYAFTFNTHIVNTDPSQPLVVNQILLYSPAQQKWDIAQSHAQSVGNTINIASYHGYADCARVVIWSQPDTIHSTLPWTFAAPIETIAPWNPPPAPAHIIRWSNQGSNQYLVQWDQPLTITTPNTDEPALLIYEAYLGAWTAAQPMYMQDPARMRVHIPSGNNAGNQIVISMQPTTIASPAGLSVASPIANI